MDGWVGGVKKKKKNGGIQKSRMPHVHDSREFFLNIKYFKTMQTSFQGNMMIFFFFLVWIFVILGGQICTKILLWQLKWVIKCQAVAIAVLYKVHMVKYWRLNAFKTASGGSSEPAVRSGLINYQHHWHVFSLFVYARAFDESYLSRPSLSGSEKYDDENVA